MAKMNRILKFNFRQEINYNYLNFKNILNL